MSNFVNAKKATTKKPRSQTSLSMSGSDAQTSSSSSSVTSNKRGSASLATSPRRDELDSDSNDTKTSAPRKGTSGLMKSDNSTINVASSSAANAAAASAAAAAALEEVQHIQTLALGSYGYVTVVKNTASGDLFALKVAEKADVTRLHLVRSILRERKILATLDLPCVVKLVKSLRDERRVYLQMAYIGGGTLYHHIVSGGAMNEKTAIFYSAELLCALEALHGGGVAHGLLSPEHIGVNNEGHLVLLGFGHARWLSNSAAAGDNAADDEDMGTLARGIPCYIAPERLRGTPVKTEADLWAYGCVVHEMLAGVPPFLASSPEATFELICDGRPSIAKSVPTNAVAMIRKLLVVEPGKRDDIAAVREQKWFKGVDWAATAKRKGSAPLSGAATKMNDDLLRAASSKASAKQQQQQREDQLALPPSIGPPVDVDGRLFAAFH